MIRRLTIIVVGVMALDAPPLAAEQTISRGQNISADITNDGRVAIDLMGDLWIVPPSGETATRVTRDLRSVQRPRWSPDGSRIAYQAISDGTQGLWIHDLTTGQPRNISRSAFLDVHPAWHPDGERLVYASDSTGDGFDLWEVDLPTGLHWRLSNHPGDETDPSWSASGRDLVYVRRQGDLWSLVLRRHGLSEETLLSTTDRIAGPSWRPDGSLITFVREGTMGTTIEMVILSQPRLLRAYARNENFVLAPVSWLDKHRMIYTSDGLIRQRLFNSWASTTLPFRATLESKQPAPVVSTQRRELPRIDEPAGRFIVHASRLFDGVGTSYQSDRDIIIEAGRISAVEPHRDRADSIVINMGNLAVLPGFIDAAAALPADTRDELGALLLTTGVTSLVTEHTDAERLNTLWSSKQTPGPRVLGSDDWSASADSAIADAMTPGLHALLQSRQSGLLGATEPVARRFAEPPSITAGSSSLVLGSQGNGLPPGLALHAELRALSAAGLRPEQALRAAGANAAAALRVDPTLGRIAVGASADLVFVDGDPLANVLDALNIVAVVRNGRFFSVAGLIERFQTAESVD